MKMYTNRIKGWTYSYTTQMTKKELLIYVFLKYGERIEHSYEHQKDEEIIEVYYTIGNISYVQNITDQFSYLSHSKHYLHINMNDMYDNLDYFDFIYGLTTIATKLYIDIFKPEIESIVDSFLLKERLAEELKDNQEQSKKIKI